MKNFWKFALVAVAFTTSSLLSSTETQAAAGFSNYYASSPDFSVSSVSQDINSYDYNVRVCNIGSTPSASASMRISIERSGKTAESQTFYDVFIRNGGCEDFSIEGIYSFGKYNERNYALSVTATWNGKEKDKNTTNNRKTFPAMEGASGGSTKYSNTTPSRNTTTSPSGSLFRVSDPSLQYQRTNPSYTDDTYYYRWNGVSSSYVDGTSGYYSNSRSDYNNYSYDTYLAQFPNFFVSRITFEPGVRNIIASYCNDGASMKEYQNVAIRFENANYSNPRDYTEYIKLLSGQCRDIKIAVSSLGMSDAGNYTVRVTIDPNNLRSERVEGDNTRSETVYVTSAGNRGICAYRDGYYYDTSTNERFWDNACYYRLSSYTTSSCIYWSGYYFRDGYFYSDSSCTARAADVVNNCRQSSDGYYYRNGDRYADSSCNNYLGRSSNCAYSDGYYYQNGNRYSDSSCRNRLDNGYSYYSCTYSSGYYYKNGDKYSDSSCNYRVYDSSSSCTYSGGYYYRNGDRYTDSSCNYRAYDSYYGSCTYSGGYYYRNGERYTDSSCNYRYDSNNYSSCSYSGGYYYRNGERYTDSYCTYRSYDSSYGSCTYSNGYYYQNGDKYSDSNCYNRSTNENNCYRSSDGSYRINGSTYTYSDSSCRYIKK